MKKIIILILTGFMIQAVSGCSSMMDIAASMQKGRYIVAGKLIDPPYSDPMQNVSNGKIWVNGIYLTKEIKDPGSAKLLCEEYQRQMKAGSLMILGGEKSDEYYVMKDGEKKFNEIKAVLASNKTKNQKIKELNTILEGTVDGKLVLESNSAK